MFLYYIFIYNITNKLIVQGKKFIKKTKLIIIN